MREQQSILLDAARMVTIRIVDFSFIQQKLLLNFLQGYFTEVNSRTQGSRPRTQKKSEAKDSLSEDRPSRGQGQECPRPRPRTKDTAASVLQKKKGLQKSFSGNLQLLSVA